MIRQFLFDFLLCVALCLIVFGFYGVLAGFGLYEYVILGLFCIFLAFLMWFQNDFALKLREKVKPHLPWKRDKEP